MPSLVFTREHPRTLSLLLGLLLSHRPPSPDAPRPELSTPSPGLLRRLDGPDAVAHISSPPHLVLLLALTTNFGGGGLAGPLRQRMPPVADDRNPRTMRVVVSVILIAPDIAGP